MRKKLSGLNMEAIDRIKKAQIGPHSRGGPRVFYENIKAKVTEEVDEYIENALSEKPEDFTDPSGKIQDEELGGVIEALEMMGQMGMEIASEIGLEDFFPEYFYPDEV